MDLLKHRSGSHNGRCRRGIPAKFGEGREGDNDGVIEAQSDQQVLGGC